jgi:hypothetical protein
MSATVDPRQNATVSKSQAQAVASLNREFLAVLVSEEAANIGRTVAQIVRGDGWHEAKSSAVLVDAIAGWLGRDVVMPVGFFANGTGPVEIIAQVGNFYITGHGIEGGDDLTVNCCERHRARFSQSRLDTFDVKLLGQRFTWGTPLAQRAADRLAVLLAEEVDPEIARVILGIL